MVPFCSSAPIEKFGRIGPYFEVYFPINQLFANMKKEENCLRLEEIRSALAEADAERLRAGVSAQERELMEEACVTLREAERRAIVNAETGLVERFRESAGSVNLQAKRIRALVTKLNKIPKGLDTVESVIKECVKVLRAIAMWCTMLFLLVFMGSCASMSKAQLKRVGALAVVSDSAVAGPGSVFRLLDEVRVDRGLMYAASLSGAEARVAELNGVALGSAEFSRLSEKADVCVGILESYIRALKSLSNEARWRSSGVELRGIGRNIDSLAIAYSGLGFDELYEPGLAKQLGKTSGYLAEQYGKRRQLKLVRQIVAEGDSIVGTCCSLLIAALKSPEMLELIENERVGLEQDYKAYLNSCSVRGVEPWVEFDRVYVEDRLKIEASRDVRRQCITRLQAFRRAHAALLRELQDGHRTYDEFSDALFELNRQIVDIGDGSFWHRF